MKKYLILAIFAAIIACFLFIYFLPKEQKEFSFNPNQIFGNENAKIEIFEFSDYQCPFCAKFATQVFPLIKRNFIDKGLVKWYFLDFPLPFHNNAFIAHKAAKCAGEQGKYLEMHDLLFERQNEWATSSIPKSIFESYAKMLSLNIDLFENCLNSNNYDSEIRNSINFGKSKGIKGTPTFFINGKEISGFLPYDEFKKEIENIVSQSQ